MIRESTPERRSENNIHLVEGLGKSVLSVLDITDPSQIEVVNKWYRGGDENYVADFRLYKNSDLDEYPIHLIAKACVSTSFGMSLTERVDMWLERRQVLAASGVLFPKLYGRADGATLVEEFIPFTFGEAYGVALQAYKIAVSTSNEQEQELRLGELRRLKEDYINTTHRIVAAGFLPLDLHLGDARSHGNDVVVIDVGSDLAENRQGELLPDYVEAEALRSFKEHLRRKGLRDPDGIYI